MQWEMKLQTGFRCKNCRIDPKLEKTEEEILLSKSIENWKAGKTEEGAGQLEEYFEKMAVKLAAIHKGRD